jgi:very-short-patch-repair endonuclease
MYSRHEVWSDVHRAAAEQLGAITTRQLREIGLSDSARARRYAAGDLGRLGRGVYGVAGLLTPWSHHAALCLLSPEAVVSHGSAAAWWELDGVDGIGLEVTVPITSGFHRRPGIKRTRHLDAHEIVACGPLRVTDPTRTLIDWAPRLSRDALERAIEGAVRRRQTSAARLRWRAQALARPGRAGPGRILRALDRAGSVGRAESDLEVRVVQLLRRAGVPAPLLQHSVRLPDGNTARLDMAYPEQRLCIEVDGWAAHGGRAAFQRDRARQNMLVLLGWRPLRFTWSDITHRPAWVAAQVKAALAGVA